MRDARFAWLAVSCHIVEPFHGLACYVRSQTERLSSIPEGNGDKAYDTVCCSVDVMRIFVGDYYISIIQELVGYAYIVWVPSLKPG